MREREKQGLVHLKKERGCSWNDEIYTAVHSSYLSGSSGQRRLSDQGKFDISANLSGQRNTSNQGEYDIWANRVKSI